MYACTHASTPGTTAPQRQGEELMQTPEASHISPVQRNPPHLASQCWDFIVPTSRDPNTLQPPGPPLFPIYPSTVHGPRQAWFYCPTLIVVQSAHHALPHSAPSQLWRSSMQLYNGPLRSCRKIRGKSAVQQSPSRRARRSPSPRCRMWLPQETRGQTTSAHLYWCGADPSGPWPAPVASHEGHCPERIHIFAILAGFCDLFWQRQE